MGERQARRRIGIGAVVVLGGAAAIGAVLWTGGGLVPYLLALALAAVGVLVLLTALPTARWRALGTALTVLALALAVAVPWRLAVRELHGDPLWSLDVQGFVRRVHSDETRLLYSDDVGLHAVDLASGEELWVHDPSGAGTPRRFHVATDGHVLVQYESRRDQVLTQWISPGGEVLWSHPSEAAVGDGDGAPVEIDLEGHHLRDPVAAADGVLVVVTCADDADHETCRTLGIGPDGTEAWSRASHPRPLGLRTVRQVDVDPGEPRQIPAVAAVHGPDSSTRAPRPTDLLDPATGEVLGTLEVAGFFGVMGDVVVHESAEQGPDGLCTTRGWSADGRMSWERDLPCLGRGAVAIGDWIYGTLRTVQEADGETLGEDVPVEAYALDPETGARQAVGPLDFFSSRAAPRTGVPGTDVVVQSRDQQITAVDPATGEETWSFGVTGTTIVPGVEAAHGAVVVRYDVEDHPGRNPFLAGDDLTLARRILAVDTATGQVTGSLLTPDDVWVVAPVAPGQVAVAAGDRLVLIGTRPS